MTKLYDAKFIVKMERVRDTVVETYVESRDGIVYLRTYVDYKLYSETVITDLNTTGKE